MKKLIIFTSGFSISYQINKINLYPLKYTTVVLILIFQSASLFGQDGQLDPSFATNGIATTQISEYDDFCSDVALQSDGKIVAVGYTDYGFDTQYCVVRYNTDGNLDSTFGVNGMIDGDLGFGGYNLATCVTIVNDKILIAGNGDDGSLNNGPAAFVERFNNDGSPDSSFGVNGLSIIFPNPFTYVFFRITDIAVQSDGKIVLAAYEGTNGGNEDFTIIRFTSSGMLDNSFGIDGIAITPFYNGYTDVPYSVIIDANEKIVAAGVAYHYSAIARYNSDGSFDASFGAGGQVESESLEWGLSSAVDIASAQNNKLLVACSTYGVSFKVGRFNQNGTLDSTFGINGLAAMNVEGNAQAMSVQEDNKIILAGEEFGGSQNYFGIGRFLPNGAVDSTFGSGGFVTTDVGNFCTANAIVIQPDGKILAAGSARKGGNFAFVLARYISSYDSSIAVGTVDNPSVLRSEFVYPNPVKFSTTLEYTLTEEEFITIELLDLQGRSVKYFLQSEIQKASNHLKQLEFPKTLLPGNYILKITAGSNQVSIKITKQ
jgi:uncharacterized delta-60 repeat protein